MTKIKLAVGAFVPTLLTAGLLVGSGVARSQDRSTDPTAKSVESPTSKQPVGPGARVAEDVQQFEQQLQDLRSLVAEQKARLERLESQLKNAENNLMTANTRRALIKEPQKNAGGARVPNTGGGGSTKALDSAVRILTTEKELPPAHEAPPLDEETAAQVALWSQLLRDGFVARFDANEEPASELLTRIFRHYLRRKPSSDELAQIQGLSYPGSDQVRSYPEQVVRKALRSEKFLESQLATAILEKAKPLSFGTRRQRSRAVGDKN